MTADPRLLSMLQLRAEAERLAQEHVDQLDQLFALEGKEDWWRGRQDQMVFEVLIEAHARLLADPTRPESRDWMARELAQAVGLEVGETAPTWARSGRGEYRLRVPGPAGQLAGIPRLEDLERRFGYQPPGSYMQQRHPGLYVTVLALHDITDPGVALVACLLAVWEGAQDG